MGDAMEYLKLFTDFIEDLEPLSDAECGRLFRAALEYARTGTPPTLSGNERFLWSNVRKQIDRSEQAYQAKANGAAKARAKKSSEINLIGLDIKAHQHASMLKGLDNSQEEEEEEDKEDIKEKKQAKKERFSPPSVDDVREYCRTSGHMIDAEAFVDWFTSVGWKVGSKPMKDWQAAVRNWERRDKKTPPQDKKTGNAVRVDFNDPSRDDWLKRYVRGKGD